MPDPTPGSPALSAEDVRLIGAGHIPWDDGHIRRCGACVAAVNRFGNVLHAEWPCDITRLLGAHDAALADAAREKTRAALAKIDADRWADTAAKMMAECLKIDDERREALADAAREKARADRVERARLEDAVDRVSVYREMAGIINGLEAEKDRLTARVADWQKAMQTVIGGCQGCGGSGWLDEGRGRACPYCGEARAQYAALSGEGAGE